MDPEGAEPAGAEGVEICSSAGRVTADQSGAGGTMEPGGAARLRVSGGAEGGRSQGDADRLTGRGGAKGSEAECGDEGFSCLGAAGECTT